MQTITQRPTFIYPAYPAFKLPGYREHMIRYLRTRDNYVLLLEVEINVMLHKDSHQTKRLLCHKRNGRLIIYPKDIAAIFGKSESSARRLLQIIRDSKGLPPKAPITIRDFCDNTSLDYDTIHAYIMEH